MSEVIKLLQPEWPYTMAYQDFLEKVIEYGRIELETNNRISTGILRRGYRAYRNCEGKSYLKIKELYNNAIMQYKESIKINSTYSAHLDMYQKSVKWVLMCVAEAYGVEVKPGFISEKAKKVTAQILNGEIK